MSDTISVEIPVYSPRWGHNNTYRISLSREKMQIEFPPRVITCSWVENQDPVWETLDDSLFEIFENDSIHAPHGFFSALEYAWTNWRNSELDDSEAEKALSVLFDWLNAVTEGKPNTDFWKKWF